MKLNYHEFCSLMPDMDQDVYEATKASMRENGFSANHPIMRYRDQIIDGRHRLRMVEELQAEGIPIEAVFSEWVPPEWAKTEPQIENALWIFCLNENAHRRHIPHRQLIQLLVLRGGLAKKPDLNITQEAKRANVSRTSLSEAVKIAKESPKVARQVASGKVSAGAALERLKDKEQPAAVPVRESNDKDFERLEKSVRESATLLSRMKVIGESLSKRVPGGEQFVRTMSAAFADVERWKKMLDEWSKTVKAKR